MQTIFGVYATNIKGPKVYSKIRKTKKPKTKQEKTWMMHVVSWTSDPPEKQSISPFDHCSLERRMKPYRSQHVFKYFRLAHFNTLH